MPLELPSPWESIGYVFAPDQLQTLDSIPGSSHNEHDRSWLALRNRDTGRRVLLRLQVGPELMQAGDQSVPVRVITSVVFPDSDGVEVTGSDLRGLPLKAISAAVTRERAEYPSRRRARHQRETTLGGHSLPSLANRDEMSEDEFFAAVAQHWMDAHEAGEPSPADRLVSATGVSKRTAQRWAAEARRRGFLPVALTGLPGRRPRSS